MSDRFVENDEIEDRNFLAGRIAYIKPTGSDEAHRVLPPIYDAWRPH